MRKQNGFTLVELMAVILILGLLLAIVIPSSLKISSKVKDNAYGTKVTLIESAAKDYGQSNVSLLRKGTDVFDQSKHYTCSLYFDSKDKLSEVRYNYQAAGYSETKTLADNEFWCFRLKIEDLVKSENLTWDEKNRCVTCGEPDKSLYNDVVLNTKNSYIINKCYVYVYYKYNRVYAVFDHATCGIQTETPTDGHEYKALYVNNN